MISDQFGDRQVTPDQRKDLIGQVFQAVAGRYDLMNDAMSFGIHRLWKRSMAAAVAAGAEATIIDLAGGTGDVARLLWRPGRHVTVCDPSRAMMAVGRRRCAHQIGFVEGMAEAMPFPDDCADVVTMAFGLRNVTDLDASLREIRRVLKPGGVFYCLEFSRPRAWLRPFYETYSRLVIPRLGALVAGQPAAYDYLIQSIRRFPDQAHLAALFSRAGFSQVAWTDYSFGIACLHWGRKE